MFKSRNIFYVNLFVLMNLYSCFFSAAALAKPAINLSIPESIYCFNQLEKSNLIKQNKTFVPPEKPAPKKSQGSGTH